jgi:GAF domain-containing protein/ActR/RegA family two-component response regulator
MKALVTRYGMAPLTVSLASGLTHVLWPHIQLGATSPFFAAVMLTAWYGGLGPGLAASGLAVLAVEYSFIPPYYAFEFGPDAAVRVLVFLSAAVLTSSLTERCKQAEAALQTLHVDLEQAITARTAELSDANARLKAEIAERQSAEATGNALTDIAQALTQSLHPDVVAKRIADSVRELLHAESSTVFRLDPGTGDLVALAASGHVGPTFSHNLVFPRGTGVVGRAVRERAAVIVSDLLSDPRVTLTTETRARIEQATYRAVLAIPLQAQDRIIGALGVGDRLDRVFDSADVRLAQAFADHAAVALANAQLYEETERRRRSAETSEQALRQRVAEMESIVEVGRAITSLLDLGDVLELIVDRACLLLGARRFALALVESEHTESVLRFVARRGLSTAFPERMRPAHWRDGTTPTAISERRTVWSSDLLNDPQIVLAPSTRAAVEAEGYRGVLSVPLIAADRALGALVMYRDTPGPFALEEIQLLETFAAQAAIAVENARLYAGQQSRAARLRTLARLNGLVSSSLDTTQVLGAIADAAAELMDAPAVAVWIADESAETLELRAFSDPQLMDADFQGNAFRYGEGGPGWVARQRRALAVTDVLADERVVDAGWFRRHGLRSTFMVPVEHQHALLGVLALFGREPFALSRDDHELLESFVAQAAVAIRNAGLYQRLNVAHEQLEHRQTQLIQVERLRALGEMAAGVAHDFNNLLAVILGRADLLLRQPRDPRVAQGLETIRQAARDGAQTVRRIQEFTRTRTTRPHERVDVRTLIHEVIDLTRPRWKDEPQSCGITYDVRIEGETVSVVAGLPGELREVFTNILSNALDAMPTGGSCVFMLTADVDWVTVAVRDSGMGMTEDACQRVFDPFYTTKGPRGTGLGLAVSWGIVARHGGTIGVESVPGLGTTFTVRLPRTEDLPVCQAVLPSPAQVHGARVLVIDDEPAVREMLVDMLTSGGYQVTSASDGRQGLNRCEHERFDLVLSDLSMPELSGWDVALACAERFPLLPIGLVTGWGDQLDQGRLDQSKVRFVLAKPLETQIVLDHVARAITGSTENQMIVTN